METDNAPVRPRARVRAIKFWQKYVTGADGTPRAIDWVSYCVPGNEKYLVTPDAVERVKKLTDGTWECLKDAYDAWKSGQEIPLNGTPLGAWSGITQEQASILKTMGFKTIEDVAEMSDGQKQKTGIPEIRWLSEQARAWIKSKDTRAIEVELANDKEEIEILKQRLEDMQALLSGGHKQSVDEPIVMPGDNDIPVAIESPKRRGRPPKVREAA